MTKLSYGITEGRKDGGTEGWTDRKIDLNQYTPTFSKRGIIRNFKVGGIYNHSLHRSVSSNEYTIYIMNSLASEISQYVTGNNPAKFVFSLLNFKF